MTEELKRFLIERINTCPYNLDNGIVATFLEEGHSVIEVDVKPEHKNIWGIPHGGLLFAIADVASGLAAHSVHEGAHVVTASSNVNFLFASPDARHLKAEGRVIKAGHTLAVMQADVYDELGNHLITGQFTMHVAYAQ